MTLYRVLARRALLRRGRPRRPEVTSETAREQIHANLTARVSLNRGVGADVFGKGAES